jgi:hypothetical protein
MKSWLRENPSVLPGHDPSDHTSHQLRGLLRRAGWRVEQTPSEEFLYPPELGSEALADFVKNVDADPDREDLNSLEEEASEIAFELEHQLRDFIASNLPSIQIGSNKLALFVDPSGRHGVEYPSAVGPIDILAMAPGGALYVFELKRASAPDKAIGQLARYMGWLRTSGLARGEVHGVIVARQISPNLRFAASIIPNVSLFEYRIAFSLDRVPPPGG